MAIPLALNRKKTKGSDSQPAKNTDTTPPVPTAADGTQAPGGGLRRLRLGKLGRASTDSVNRVPKGAAPVETPSANTSNLVNIPSTPSRKASQTLAAKDRTPGSAGSKRQLKRMFGMRSALPNKNVPVPAVPAGYEDQPNQSSKPEEVPATPTTKEEPRVSAAPETTPAPEPSEHITRELLTTPLGSSSLRSISGRGTPGLPVTTVPYTPPSQLEPSSNTTSLPQRSLFSSSETSQSLSGGDGLAGPARIGDRPQASPAIPWASMSPVSIRKTPASLPSDARNIPGTLSPPLSYSMSPEALARVTRPQVLPEHNIPLEPPTIEPKYSTDTASSPSKLAGAHPPLQSAFTYATPQAPEKEEEESEESHVYSATALGHDHGAFDGQSNFSHETAAATLQMHDAPEHFSDAQEKQSSTLLGSTVLGAIADGIGGALRHQASLISMSNSTTETAPDVDDEYDPDASFPGDISHPQRSIAGPEPENTDVHEDSFGDDGFTDDHAAFEDAETALVHSGSEEFVPAEREFDGEDAGAVAAAADQDLPKKVPETETSTNDTRDNTFTGATTALAGFAPKHAPHSLAGTAFGAPVVDKPPEQTKPAREEPSMTAASKYTTQVDTTIVPWSVQGDAPRASSGPFTQSSGHVNEPAEPISLDDVKCWSVADVPVDDKGKPLPLDEAGEPIIPSRQEKGTEGSYTKGVLDAVASGLGLPSFFSSRQPRKDVHQQEQDTTQPETQVQAAAPAADSEPAESAQKEMPNEATVTAEQTPGADAITAAPEPETVPASKGKEAETEPEAQVDHTEPEVTAVPDVLADNEPGASPAEKVPMQDMPRTLPSYLSGIFGLGPVVGVQPEPIPGRMDKGKQREPTMEEIKAAELERELRLGTDSEPPRTWETTPEMPTPEAISAPVAVPAPEPISAPKEVRTETIYAPEPVPVPEAISTPDGAQAPKAQSTAEELPKEVRMPEAAPEEISVPKADSAPEASVPAVAPVAEAVTAPAEVPAPEAFATPKTAPEVIPSPEDAPRAIPVLGTAPAPEATGVPETVPAAEAFSTPKVAPEAIPVPEEPTPNNIALKTIQAPEATSLPEVTPEAISAPGTIQATEKSTIPETTPEALSTPQAVPAYEGVVVPEAAHETVPGPEREPVPEAISVPQAVSVPETTSVPEVVSEPISAPKTAPAPENISVPETDPFPKDISVPDAALEDASVPEAVPAHETVPAPEAVPAPEPVSVPKVTPAAETISAPKEAVNEQHSIPGAPGAVLGREHGPTPEREAVAAPERTSQMLPYAAQVPPASPEHAPAKEAATEASGVPAAVSTPVSATPKQSTASSEAPSTPQQSTSDSAQREQSNSSKRLSRHFSLDGAKAGILGTAAVLSSSFSRSFNRRTSTTPELETGIVPPTIPQKDPGRFSFRAFSESLFENARAANTPEAEAEQKASAPTTGDHGVTTNPDQAYQPGIPEQKDVSSIDTPDSRPADPAANITQPSLPEAPKPSPVPNAEPDFARSNFEPPEKQTGTSPQLQAEIPLHPALEPEREPALAAYPEPQHEPMLESRPESQYKPQTPLWQQQTKAESQEPRPQRKWSAGPQWQESQHPLQNQLQRPQEWQREVLPLEQPIHSQVPQMPSQVQPLTPKAKPITSNIEAFTPEIQSLTPQARPVNPQTETDIPKTQPFIPQAQPFIPRVQPLTYQAQSSTPQAQPLTTEAQGFTTQTDPATNQVESSIPQTQPFTPQTHPLPAQEQPSIPKTEPTTAQFEAVPGLQQPINLEPSRPTEQSENAFEVRSSLSSQYSAQSADDTPEGVRSSKTYFPETIAEYMYQMSAHGHVMIPSTTGHDNAEEEEPEISPEPNHSAFEPVNDNYYEPPRQETIMEDPAAEAAAEAAGDETAQNNIVQHKGPTVNMPDAYSAATTPRKAYTPVVKEAPLPPLPPATSHSLPATPKGYESSRNLLADTTLPPQGQRPSEIFAGKGVKWELTDWQKERLAASKADPTHKDEFNQWLKSRRQLMRNVYSPPRNSPRSSLSRPHISSTASTEHRKLADIMQTALEEEPSDTQPKTPAAEPRESVSTRLTPPRVTEQPPKLPSEHMSTSSSLHLLDRFLLSDTEPNVDVSLVDFSNTTPSTPSLSKSTVPPAPAAPPARTVSEVTPQPQPASQAPPPVVHYAHYPLRDNAESHTQQTTPQKMGTPSNQSFVQVLPRQSPRDGSVGQPQNRTQALSQVQDQARKNQTHEDQAYQHRVRQDQVHLDQVYQDQAYLDQANQDQALRGQQNQVYPDQKYQDQAYRDQGYRYQGYQDRAYQDQTGQMYPQSTSVYPQTPAQQDYEHSQVSPQQATVQGYQQVPPSPARYGRPVAYHAPVTPGHVQPMSPRIPTHSPYVPPSPAQTHTAALHHYAPEPHFVNASPAQRRGPQLQAYDKPNVMPRHAYAQMPPMQAPPPAPYGYYAPGGMHPSQYASPVPHVRQLHHGYASPSVRSVTIPASHDRAYGPSVPTSPALSNVYTHPNQTAPLVPYGEPSTSMYNVSAPAGYHDESYEPNMSAFSAPQMNARPVGYNDAYARVPQTPVLEHAAGTVPLHKLNIPPAHQLAADAPFSEMSFASEGVTPIGRAPMRFPNKSTPVLQYEPRTSHPGENTPALLPRPRHKNSQSSMSQASWRTGGRHRRGNSSGGGRWTALFREDARDALNHI